MLTIGAPTEASGTPAAMDQGISGACYHRRILQGDGGLLPAGLGVLAQLVGQNDSQRLITGHGRGQHAGAQHGPRRG